MPQPVVETVPGAKIGLIAYGTSHWATTESRDQLLEETDVKTSYFRVRAYPFTEHLAEFIDRHERVYVIEQNRDAQLLQLMRLELDAGAHRQAAQRPALQRAADRRAQHHRRRAGAGGLRSGEENDGAASAPEAQAGSRSMATPLKVNRIGLEPAAYKGGKTTLCAGCGHNSISERIIEAFYEMGVDPGPGRQVVRHRLLQQEPGVFPRDLARLQLRSRPDAVGRHRRDDGEQESHRDRRQRRR